jgi:hypothetical protein
MPVVQCASGLTKTDRVPMAKQQNPNTPHARCTPERLVMAIG